MQLTPSQKKAVEYDSGPLLIIAGAGTGKTTVLVEKIKHIIDKKLAAPDEILALTFTDKAAREMEERVDKALPYGYFQMNISTFHAFCDMILRDEATHIGLSPGYKLISTAQQVYFLRKHLFLLDLNYFRPLGNPNKFIEGLLQHFSRLRDEDISPEDYLKWAKMVTGGPTGGPSHQREGPALGGRALNGTREEQDPSQIEYEKNLELANAYKKFQDLKVHESLVDFADLIYYTLKLFRKRPNILKAYRAKFKYILVDEFQDTNIAQYELIKLLAPSTEKKVHLNLIGDDNQSIYKFRGASVSNILQFMDDYKNAKSIVLLENFRSNQQILDSAYRLIKHNDPDTLEARLKISKNLKSMTKKTKENSVEFNLSSRVEDEAEFVAKRIRTLKKTNKWNDFAILVRANNHADPFARALARLGIPYQFLGPGMLFKQPEIKDLIAYLNVLFDINDSASFYRLLSMDFFKLDQKDIQQLLSFTRKTTLSLFSATEVYLSTFFPEFVREEYSQYKPYTFVTKKETRETLRNIILLITKALGKAKRETGGQLLYDFLDESGYLAKLMDHTTEKEERIAVNISKFFDRLKSFESQEEDASVGALVDYITMSMELGDSPLATDIDWGDYDAVNMLTVHSAKGLEFRNVFLVNLTIDRFPTRRRTEQIPIPHELIKEILPEGNYHTQEERRLFYVGLTRAKDRIVLTSANYYGEAKRERKLSPFVVETVGKKAIEQIMTARAEEKQQLSIFDTDSLEAFKKIEEPVVKQTIPLTTFSYSQIETYNLCALKYKYQYVLRIPTTPNAAASFGASIHNGLQLFYEDVKSGLKPDFKTLISYYESSWIPIGYKSKLHEDRMKIEGKTFLKKFYDTFHDKKANVLDLERWFKIKIAKDIFLSGKIDRVDHRGKQIEIIDYKTGKTPTDLEIKKNLQLSLYALAASDKGTYGKSVQDIVLTFYFLSDGRKVSLTRNQEDLEIVKKNVVETVDKIKQGNFLPHVGPWCDFCPFKINCEAWQ